MMEIEAEDLAQQFASDNYSGICPDAWAAMESANRGSASSYGDDPWTALAADAFRELFETNLRGFLCLQRHGGQLAGSGFALPVLSWRDLLRPLACGDGRVRCAGVLLQRLEAAGRAAPWRESSRRPPFTNWPPSGPTFTIPSRAWPPSRSPPSSAGFTRSRKFAPSPPPARQHGLSAAYGWSAFCQRLRQPGPLARGTELEERRGRALLWRHQERHGGGRGRALLRPPLWPPISTTAASRPGNWRRRCAFWPRPGWGCSRAAHGWPTPSTPTDARATLPSGPP